MKSVFEQVVADLSKKKLIFLLKEYLILSGMKIGAIIAKRLPEQIVKASPVSRYLFSRFCVPDNLKQLSLVVRDMDEKNVSVIFDSVLETNNKNIHDEYLKILKSVKSSCKMAFAYKLSSLFDLNQDPQNISKKFSKIVSRYQNENCSLVIDAERAADNSAIEEIGLDLIRTFGYAGFRRLSIFLTFQMYHVDSISRLKSFIEKVKEENLYCGIKLVRGAYLSEELRSGVKFPEKRIVDKQYNEAIDIVTDEPNTRNFKLMLATHNLESIDYALSLKRSKNISFAHLYGIFDTVSNFISSTGLETYKYIPFGSFEASIPYLVRRVEETSNVNSVIDIEKKIFSCAIMKRLLL